MLLEYLGGLSAAPGVHPPADVVQGLGRGDDVEGRRHRPSLLEVGDPQFRPRELPLGVSLFLERGNLWEKKGGGDKETHTESTFSLKAPIVRCTFKAKFLC